MKNPFDPGYYCSEELRGFGFAHVGDNVKIAKNCTIIGVENIEIGDNVRIDAFCSLLAASGYIRLGSNIHFCTSVMLGGRGGIEMGDFSCASAGVRIFSASDDFDGEWMASCNVPEECTDPVVEAVTIGRHVALGANSVILPGVSIGEGSAVCPLSCVTRSLTPWGMYSGAPARRVRERSQRLLRLEGHIAA